MKEPILETLAGKYDCFISSLPAIIGRPGFAKALLELLGRDYGMSEWNESLAYLYREEFRLSDPQQVRDYLKQIGDR